MQNILAEMVAVQRALGHRAGESAKEWARRDPEAARKAGEWIDAHKTRLVSAIGNKIAR